MNEGYKSMMNELQAIIFNTPKPGDTVTSFHITVLYKALHYITDPHYNQPYGNVSFLLHPLQPFSFSGLCLVLAALRAMELSKNTGTLFGLSRGSSAYVLSYHIQTQYPQCDSLPGLGRGSLRHYRRR